MYLSVQPSQSPQPSASMASGPPFLIRSLQFPHPLCTRKLRAPLPLHSAAELRAMIPLVSGRSDLILGSIANQETTLGYFYPRGRGSSLFCFCPVIARFYSGFSVARKSQYSLCFSLTRNCISGTHSN